MSAVNINRLVLRECQRNNEARYKIKLLEGRLPQYSTRPILFE